jgi:hypothetical protein
VDYLWITTYGQLVKGYTDDGVDLTSNGGQIRAMLR